MMKKNLSLSLGLVVFSLMPYADAQGVLVESWENTLNGWAVDTGGNPGYTSSFSSLSGVTAGSFSLALTGTNGPTYGNMLSSAFQSSYTTVLGSSSAVTLDVFTPSASFGFFLQIQFWINNADTGYQQLTSYLATTIGSETTLTFPIPPAISSTLAASSNPTQMGFQMGGGYSSGNETMYLDNLQAISTPEPGTAALFGLGALSLLIRRRRKTC